MYLGSCSAQPCLWHLVSLQKMDIGKKDRTSFKSRTTDVGTMVSVRISYIYDEGLCESQIMARWQSFDFSPEFPRAALPDPLPLQSLPPSQMATATTTERKSRPATASSRDVPPPCLIITLPFTRLLLLPPWLSCPHLCSIGCPLQSTDNIKTQSPQHSVKLRSPLLPHCALHSSRTTH